VSAGKCLILVEVTRPSLQSGRLELDLPAFGAFDCGFFAVHDFFQRTSNGFGDIDFDIGPKGIAYTSTGERQCVFLGIAGQWPSSVFAKRVFEPVDTWDHRNIVACRSDADSLVFLDRSLYK
jgi:hypothetical protein